MSYDIKTSSTLPWGKSPTVQRMEEFCTLRVADGCSNRWKSAHPSASPSVGRSLGHRHSRSPDGRLFFTDGRPPTRPHAERRRPSRRASTLATARQTAASVPPAVRLPSVGPIARRKASSVPRLSPRLSTARTASCLIPAPDSLPPPPTILSMVEFQVSIKRAAQTPSVCFRTYVSQEL